MTYLNMKTNHGTETVDEIDPKEFITYTQFLKEKRRLIQEYRMCNMNVYSSQRCTNDWKD